MINQRDGLLRFPYLGKVVQDKGEGDWDILVYPMEIVPTYTGDLTAKNDVNVENVDIFGNNINVTVDVNRTLKCRWLPLFGTSNRVTPPSVRAGETVVVINFAGTDKYFWVNGIYADTDLRKLENMILFLSNKQDAGDDSLDKGYYIRLDTYKKVFHIHTSDNDNELTTYDININTKDGILEITDGRKNNIKLMSGQDKLDINTNNEMVITTTNKVVINTTDAEVNATESIRTKSRIAHVIARDAIYCKTTNATIEASDSATVDTKLCRITSKVCRIN